VAGQAGVDAYLAGLPANQREALARLRRTILAAVPDAGETISYGMPAVTHGGRALVAYAAFKAHCSLFPMSVRAIESLSFDATPYRAGKGTLRFTSDAPLPDELVGEIVAVRIAEIATRRRP
jgi:uncharacterized protein YdhG (YjbR/CyaY superfamily)